MAAASRKARFFCSVLLRLLLLYMPRVIHATDMLQQGEILKDVDGALLVSPGKTFALGFFSPGNRTSRRYVGIWYRGIPDLTVVWVANRDAPVLHRSGTFTLRSDGTLVVSDSLMTVLWSSGTSNNSTLLVPSTSVVNASARLLDTGNLVVNDVGGSSAGNSVVLWQTFDHPADTFLPGMHSGLDLRTGENTLWTSWASPDDPAPGRFYAGVDPRPLAQLVLWERVNATAGANTSEGGLVRRWRTGQWNGQSFTGVSHMKPQNLFGTKFSNPVDEKRMYFTYTVYNTNYVRIVVRPDGIYTIYTRNNEIGGSREWDTVFAQPLTACEVYNACGSNAVCTEKDEGRSKRCDCWRGFRPRSKQEWDAGEYAIGGCVRNTPLSCQLTSGTSDISSGRQPQPMSPGDAFWGVGGVKLPDASDWVGDVDAQGCRKVCGGNCSCTAYAYVSGIGCMVWGNDLADVHNFSSGGNDVYVKVPASELPPDSTSKKSKHLLVGLVLMGSVFTVAIILVFFIQGMKLVLWKKTDGEELEFFDLEIEKKSEQGSMPDLPLVSLKAIEAATDKFSEWNVLGRGGFGTVYKGKINGGQEVAVKRLSRDSGQGVEEFKNEAILIAKLQHKNLVRLRGCCTQGEEKILVYEYMPNKSLDVFLFDPDNRASLSWEIRFNIIQGIARGLLYLHHDSRLRVIHRDLKASNILLDEDMQPKISDFGIARIFECNQNHANTKRVVGTYGYMSPEYAMDGLFSIKSDVYSFGVLVLEILSGKRNQIILDSAGSSDSLLGRAWQLWNEDQALEFIDPLIRTTCCEKEALRCMHIGLSCVQDRTADRPTVPSVILMLGNESITYAAVKQPTFSAERNIRTIDSLVENTISDIITGR